MSNVRNLEVVQSTGIPAIVSRFQSDLLTRREAAAYLGVTPETLAVWASTRRYPLRFVKIGRLAKYRLCRIRHKTHTMAMDYYFPVFVL